MGGEPWLVVFLVVSVCACGRWSFFVIVVVVVGGGGVQLGKCWILHFGRAI